MTKYKEINAENSIEVEGYQPNGGYEPTEDHRAFLVNSDFTGKEEVHWQLEEIVNHSMSNGKLYFFVKWLNWSTKDNTWEPIEKK